MSDVMAKIPLPPIPLDLIHILGSGLIFKAALVGPPGSHKWKLGEMLVKTFRFTHMPLQEGIKLNIMKDSKFGQLAKTCMTKGIVIPDAVLMRFVSREIMLSELDRKSWVVSGFPVTLNQAKIFWEHGPIHMVIHVNFPEDYVEQTLIKRYSPADTEKPSPALMDQVLKLMSNYDENSKPMLQYYKDLEILNSFYSNRFDSMWAKIEDRVRQKLELLNKQQSSI